MFTSWSEVSVENEFKPNKINLALQNYFGTNLSCVCTMSSLSITIPLLRLGNLRCLVWNHREECVCSSLPLTTLLKRRLLGGVFFEGKNKIIAVFLKIDCLTLMR